MNAVCTRRRARLDGKQGRICWTNVEANDDSPGLLQRIAAGDENAVRECIDTYSGLVWSIARRFSRNTEDAADGVQDVFIDLWSAAARFDPTIAAEKTFVAMIARRRLIDRLRKLRRQPDFTGLEDAAVIPAEEQRDQVEIREEAERVMDVMRTLKPEQQQILELAIHKGMTHRGIAEHLQLPLGTVKTHVRRGLMRVRELVRRGEEDPS